MNANFKTKAMAWARGRKLLHVALVAWILDVLSCLYMVRWWESKDMEGRLMGLTLQMAQVSINDIPPNAEAEFIGMAQMIFGGMLLALIITNSIFYTGYVFRKKWSVGYVTAYLVTAGLIGVTFLFEGFPVGGAWELVNILGIPAYLVLGFIAWTVKKDLNPAAGNPAR